MWHLSENAKQLSAQNVVGFLRFPFKIGQVLFERTYQAHGIDNGGAFLLQVVVAAPVSPAGSVGASALGRGIRRTPAPPDADAGDKFIFHSKILLCDIIVPQRRISVNYAILLYPIEKKHKSIHVIHRSTSGTTVSSKRRDQKIELVDVELNDHASLVVNVFDVQKRFDMFKLLSERDQIVFAHRLKVSSDV